MNENRWEIIRFWSTQCRIFEDENVNGITQEDPSEIFTVYWMKTAKESKYISHNIKFLDISLRIMYVPMKKFHQPSSTYKQKFFVD